MESAIDVDNHDESDNAINTEQENQANKQSKKRVKLLKMPIEILEQIFIHLDNKHLLIASHVCKLLASVAETAFAKKYSKEYYEILSECETSFHKVMLNKYGDKIRKIIVSNEDEELVDLVQQKCSNAESLNLLGVPKMILLMNLKEVILSGVCNLNRARFDDFINNNNKLESLELRFIEVDLLDILNDRLNVLKNLSYYCATKRGAFPATIGLQSLEKLSLLLKDSDDYIRFLRAMNSAKIKTLVLYCCGPDGSEGNVINEICSFQSLQSLQLSNYGITTDEMRNLATHLPHLIEFSVTMAEGEANLENKIHSILSIFPKLTKLGIKLHDDDFSRFLDELKRSFFNEFDVPFNKNNTEIKISNRSGMVSITKDRVFMSEKDSFQVYWMENLNKENVGKVKIPWSRPKELKFINNCSDPNFDIYLLANLHIDFDGIKCLNLKSNGSLSINSNVLRYHDWLPCLKVLKIHLELRSAIDFLRCVNENFSGQIEELWLFSIGQEEELGTGDDMSDILAKFKNLKSLYLNSAFSNFNAKCLWSVCRNLRQVKITK